MSVTALLYAIGIIVLIISITYYTKQKRHRIQTALIGMGSGVAALIPLHFILGYFGIMLAINYFTIIISLAFGVPGVIGMVIVTLL